VAAAPLAAACAASAAPPQARPVRLERSIAAGVRFLEAQIDENGRCKAEFAEDSRNHGGRTALVAYALLTAGADHRRGPTARAMQWLTAADLNDVYAVSMRLAALSAVPDARVMPRLQQETKRLIAAANAKGAYTYSCAPGGSTKEYDNSNSHLAAMAVWAAERRGAEVPLDYWKRVERHWLDDQQPDGAWGYFVRPEAVRNKTYGSMTAAGLATLYVCFDRLHREGFIRCRAAEEPAAIRKGLQWLAAEYSAMENPKLGANWYYYWLFCLERVGLASGRKQFGGHDWYAEASARLIRTQNEDGSWGYGDRLHETAFALVFLTRGRNPVLLYKLQYKGKWNSRPRDAANLARFVSREFERPVNWQIVPAGAKPDALADAPLLYISGAGPVELTDEQIDSLRQFVLRGGLIVSEAACNSGSFTLDMRKTYARMFPGMHLARLEGDHPVYSVNFRMEDKPELLAVSNGVRLLAVHATQQVSLDLQLARKTNRTGYELMTNLLMLATDGGRLHARGGNAWPTAGEAEPAATIRLARIRHAGNWRPEPLAFERLAAVLAREHRIRLETTAVGIEGLDATKWPVAHITGMEAFKLTEADRKALHAYLKAGGTLIADAAGGAKEFADSVRKEIVPLTGDSLSGQIVSKHAVYQSPHKIETVTYRRQIALELAAGATAPRLNGAAVGKRVAVIYSEEDITSGLVGYAWHGLRGYTPESSVRLMTNLLCYGAGVKTEKTGQEPSAPAGRP